MNDIYMNCPIIYMDEDPPKEDPPRERAENEADNDAENGIDPTLRRDRPKGLYYIPVVRDENIPVLEPLRPLPKPTVRPTDGPNIQWQPRNLPTSTVYKLRPEVESHANEFELYVVGGAITLLLLSICMTIAGLVCWNRKRSKSVKVKSKETKTGNRKSVSKMNDIEQGVEQAVVLPEEDTLTLNTFISDISLPVGRHWTQY